MIEYRVFREKIAEQGIEAFTKGVHGYAELVSVFSIMGFDHQPDHFQIGFAKRKRGLPGGDVAVERGPALVYVIGLGGVITVQLHPCKSEMTSLPEEHIFLAIGHMSAHQLISRFPKDLKRLVRMAYVSSMDGMPTISDRIWYRWILALSAHSAGSQFVPGGGRRALRSIWTFALGKAGDNTFAVVLITLLTSAGLGWIASML